MINEPKPTGVLRAKLGGAVVQLRHLPRVFAMVWEDSRGLTAAWAALLVVQGLLPVATVTLSRYLVDNVVGSLNAGLAPEVIRRVLWPAGLMGAALVTSEIVGGVLAWIRKNQTERITDRIAQDIHRTATAVDLEFYESPDYYDRLHRARSEASYRPQRIVENTGALVQGTITLLAMAGILLQFNLWVPVVLLVSTAPGFFVVAGHAVRQHLWRRRNTTDERRLWYYDYEMTRAPSAAELRLFDLGGFFKQRYRELRARLLREKLELFRAQSLSEAAAGLFALIAMAASVAWVGWRALEGDFSAGDIALFYFAFRRGQDVLRSLLGNLGDVYRNVLFIGDLFEFLDSKPAIVDPVEPRPAPDVVEQGLRFERVDFSYPGSSRRVLEGFNLELPAGRLCAIVGPNGSGKSTLIKLICRLYDPQGGRVTLDGIDLKDLELAELRRLVTVLFQRPVQYSLSAARNVRVGDLERAGGDDAVRLAAESAGVDDLVGGLPDGYETVLGKWFEGGTELSAGEWQKVALARAFYRRSPIVLLDEPTSAMDSWAEIQWMNRLRRLMEKRTAVIVTHRFTTAMRADTIFVMRKGRVVERGTHDELVARRGFYADSWRAQGEKQ